MTIMTLDYIKQKIAHSEVIYKRGENIYRLGSYSLQESKPADNIYRYIIDGEHGDYEIHIRLNEKGVSHKCSCPFPYKGCKHVVAACIDLSVRIAREGRTEHMEENDTADLMTLDDMRNEALAARQARSRSENLAIIQGDTYKGEHLVVNENGTRYTVTVYDPVHGEAHCTCPDYTVNRLYTCKHIIFILEKFRKQNNYADQIQNERFGYAHIIYDAHHALPRCRADFGTLPEKNVVALKEYFNENGAYIRKDITELFELAQGNQDEKVIRFDGYLLHKLQQFFIEKEMAAARKKYRPDFSKIKAELYPYQREGVEFGLFKKSVLIADEMGLGKTLQAIALAVLKRDIFAFKKTLIISPSSLKEQWRSEIEKFTGEKATVISGTKRKRQDMFQNSQGFFFITNYEAVLRDIPAIRRFRPDLVILDEAQRIKNFSTRTHEAVMSIPHNHSVVLTGTPLENKLEDLYSIVQFADPELLTPLWLFAAEHFLINPQKRGKIQGYRNLDRLHEKLKPLIIRRKKEDVLESLPEKITNTYYVEMTKEQRHLHQGYMHSLLPLLSKKFHTPIDIKNIYQLLTGMRMVSNSTYLIDRKTNLSPKLDELDDIIRDVVIANGRKTVIFTEWTTMTFLIGRSLSALGVPFVEFTGKVPVNKRDSLVKEFMFNPACKVFLSTDAGGVGLNLQNADCVINFELPWNPAKLNQRIGRIIRIGQKSASVNVINLISRNSIEENVYAGIQMKQDLFDSAIEGEGDFVKFSSERKNEFINGLRAMLGEEQVAFSAESADPEEIPESTPHFLNPEVLAREETQVDLTLEETIEIVDNEGSLSNGNDATETVAHDKYETSDQAGSDGVTHEKMEAILEKGMGFLSGLMEIATGKPLLPDENSKTIQVNRDTGEVTIKFKLPGI